ncbi:MAG: InlB B-repeat-containing protein [Lachnospiraceae bacterium]|nr:InlB B-repeat-containing protein [Lachnospiraceae bacterium]
MSKQIKRLSAVLLTILMISSTVLTSFAQPLSDAADANEYEVVSEENNEPIVENADDTENLEALEEALEELLDSQTVRDDTEFLDEENPEGEYYGDNISNYGKSSSGGVLCLGDSIARGMGSNADYKNNGRTLVEYPDIQRLLNNPLQLLANMNSLPGSMNFTEKYVDGSFPAIIATKANCSNTNDFTNKSTTYWPVCFAGETVDAVNDLLGYDDGYYDTQFTHGKMDIYDLFLLPVFGSNKSENRNNVNLNNILSLEGSIRQFYGQTSGWEKKAGLIVIELGFNDVITKALVTSKLCADPMDRFLDVDDLEKNSGKYLGYMPAYSKALVDNEANWEKTYNVLLTNLQENNTKADYVLVGLYNPFGDVEVPEGFEALYTDTGAIVDKMNSYLKQVAVDNGCMYVDISDTETLIQEKGYSLIEAGKKSDCGIEYGFHPSKDGHEDIADKIIERVNEGGPEEGEGVIDVAYTVKHFRQDLDGNYTDSLAETENFLAKPDTQVTPAVKAYEGFTAPDTQTVTIASDGSTVVNYYYSRNSYTVTVSKGAGIKAVTGEGQYKYEESVKLTAEAEEGYGNPVWTGDFTKAEFTMPAKAVALTVSAGINVYTITWDAGEGKFPDGSTQKTTTVEYGKTPEEPETPTKTADAVGTYTFTGWSPTISAVTGNATYTAQYSTSKNSYTITWKSGEGKFADGSTQKTTTVEYGKTPAAPETPTKSADAENTYNFSNWSPAISAVTGNATYTAQYSSSKNSYTITWKSGDGKFADGSTQKTTTVEYGKTPAVPGTPTKAADAENTYNFSSWSPSIIAVTGNATYTAQYSSSKNSYTITWKSGDGEFADGSTQKTTTVEYGKTPEEPEKPTKAADATFDGWNPAVTEVTGDITYTAVFSKKNKSNGGGSSGGSSGGSGSTTLLTGSGSQSDAPAYSPRWQIRADGKWFITRTNGQMVINAWLCDDVIPSNGKYVWYLIQADGAMLVAGLVRDNTGNYYSMEMDPHNQHFGMLRYKSGYYSCNGQVIYLELEENNISSLGAIKNPATVEKLKQIYGETYYPIDNSSAVYTSNF